MLSRCGIYNSASRLQLETGGRKDRLINRYTKARLFDGDDLALHNAAI